MAKLIATGNGVFNRAGIVIDYNGKQGHHPKGCDCVTHVNSAQINNPLMITQGVNNVTTPAVKIPDANVIAALVSNPDALNAYMATFNPSATPSVPNAVTPPVVNPIASTFVEGQNEYVIPINVTLPKKASSMAQITDARNHQLAQFTNGIHDFRFSKGYASTSIVGNGQWELVLRRKA